MTPNELIAEGRALQKPCELLVPTAAIDAVAIWHASHDRPISFEATGGVLLAIVNALGEPRVERISSLPDRVSDDVALKAIPASVLPPIEAVFAYGSEKVERWLDRNQWARSSPHNDNFPDQVVADAYLRQWQAEHPLYCNDNVYAVRGGWHFPFPDDDWSNLALAELLIMTIHDAEPYIEVWRGQQGEFHAIARVT